MKNSLLPFAFKFSVGITFLLMIHSLLLLILGLQEVASLQYVSYLMFIAGLVWAIKAYRDDCLGGYASFGEAFLGGFTVTLLTAFLYGIFTFIFVKYIDPDLVAKILERTEEAMIKQGQSDEAIETALKWTKSITSPPFMALWSLLMYLIIGSIVSLLASVFLQKEKRSGYYS